MNKITIADKEFELFLDTDIIQKRIRLLGIQLNVDYENKRPLIIGILNGSFLFMADLIKELSIDCEVAFMRLKSYEGSESTGEVKEVLGLPENLQGRDVIILEDIVDTGITIDYVLKRVKKQQPKTVKVCSLLLKPSSLKIEIPDLEYVGFEIPNDFVVGYGLDYNELGRNFTSLYKAV